MPASAPSPDPHFTAETADGVAVLTLRQDLYDSQEIERVNDAVFRYIDALEQPVMVIDLGRLRLASSRILGVLMNLHLRLVKRGGRLWLCGLSPGIQETVRLLRLDRVFNIAASPAEALARASSAAAGG